MKIPKLSLPHRLPARIGLVVLVAAVVSGLLTLGVHRLTALPDDAAFRVADTTVDEAALNERLVTLEALYGIRAPEDPQEADRFRRESAKAVAVDMVLQQAASERNIATAERSARDILARSIEQRGPGGREQFVALLGEVGASEQNVIDEIVRQQNTQRLYDEITADVPEVTEDDLRRAFEERRDLLVVPEKRQLRNLVVRTREEADAALARAVGGEDLAAVAREVSLDASTRDNGGDLGLVVREQLEGGYADAAFGVDSGTFFGPVETRFGWNVGQVMQVVPAVPLTYEQVKEGLRTSLRTERALEIWREWLRAEIQRADIEYADGYRPADPAAPPAEIGPRGGTGPAPQPEATPR